MNTMRAVDTAGPMAQDISVGVLLPIGKAQWGGSDPRELVAFASRAERLGYDSLWVNDGITEARIEALTMLAAAAPVTERVTLGTAALMPVLRRPVQAAQALASLDLLSGGRLALTVGAGFPGRFGKPIYELSGVPWANRFTRLDETVSLWRQLWSGSENTSFHGEVLHFDGLPPVATPSRPEGPPIWLAGSTPAALDRTGRMYDGWLPYPPRPADYETALADVRRATEAAGRPAHAVTPALFASVLVAPDVAAGRRTLQEFCLANYRLPLDEVERIQAVATGTAEQVAARLAEYTAAGARHLVLRLGATDLPSARDQLERIASDVLPRLREPSPPGLP
ncbi:LLM class flavin-dependent oxidoreductase [Actinomadura fibrosa]|uniref:LLM class flavin-dependent oxidoreductase n=1 Tax=Actinomadura fibrosa TaxID=111802 RepID=A0ABW2Y077_9ACTN|nr:LLM class flavin-dependent oxidoreductase [Actinomadura fibrosa]